MRRSRGFTLVVALLMLSLIGVGLMVLTTDSQGLMAASNLAHAKAVNRNLTASALNWCRSNQARLLSSDEGVDLETASLDEKVEVLQVRLLKSTDGQDRVRVTTEFRKSRTSVRSMKDYVLPD